MRPKAALPDVAEAPDGHLTAAVIDLAAIRANVRALARHARGALLQIVVKANAYGHGAVPVALAALEAGADWIGVYAPSEALALRAAGIEAPILVFGPFTEDEARHMVRERVTPTVTSTGAAVLLQDAAGAGRVRYHLKLDTGLNRSGIPVAEALPFVQAIQRLPNLRLEGIYTHFAGADEADKTLTLRQLDLLLAAEAALRASGIEVPLRHAANSAATLDLPATHLDMVRCGIATYGYYPSDQVSRRVPLAPAMSLLSTLTRVHELAPGEGVGYGHEHRCEADTTVGLVPIGYGDGVLRSLGNGRGRVLVRGRQVPIIGRVSMDQITVDLTGVPAVAGDRVTVIGKDAGAVQTADDLAMQAGTISYDIVTKLLPRVPRVYTSRQQWVGK